MHSTPELQSPKRQSWILNPQNLTTYPKLHALTPSPPTPRQASCAFWTGAWCSSSARTAATGIYPLLLSYIYDAHPPLYTLYIRHYTHCKKHTHTVTHNPYGTHMYIWRLVQFIGKDRRYRCIPLLSYRYDAHPPIYTVRTTLASHHVVCIRHSPRTMSYKHHPCSPYYRIYT